MTEPAATASPHDLLSELLRRKQAKEALVDYVAYCELGFTLAAHHQLLLGKLEAVERGEIKR